MEEEEVMEKAAELITEEKSLRWWAIYSVLANELQSRGKHQMFKAMGLADKIEDVLLDIK